jgi:hypothetical protein
MTHVIDVFGPFFRKTEVFTNNNDWGDLDDLPSSPISNALQESRQYKSRVAHVASPTPTGDRTVRDKCVLGTHRQHPFQNGETVCPLALFLLYLLTDFRMKGWSHHCKLVHFHTLHPTLQRHSMLRHYIATVLSHPTIFDLNPLFKFSLILVALARVLFLFIRIPKWQAGPNACLEVHKMHTPPVRVISFQCMDL